MLEKGFFTILLTYITSIVSYAQVYIIMYHSVTQRWYITLTLGCMLNGRFVSIIILGIQANYMYFLVFSPLSDNNFPHFLIMNDVEVNMQEDFLYEFTLTHFLGLWGQKDGRFKKEILKCSISIFSTKPFTGF